MFRQDERVCRLGSFRVVLPGTNSREQLVDLSIRDTGDPFNLRAAEEIVRVFEDSACFAGLPLELPAHRSDLRIPAHSPEQQTTEGFPTEEVIALGKIRILYRSRPDRLDYVARYDVDPQPTQSRIWLRRTNHDQSI
jgi:hypothetical protein